MDVEARTAARRAEDVGAVLALKPLSEAKSRLQLPGPLRRRLALVMFADTLRAITAVVGHTVVVSREPGLRSRLLRAGVEVDVVPDQGFGLNEALDQGQDLLRRFQVQRVLASVGDLPALRASDVLAVVDAATSRSYLADEDGVGTTMVIAPTGRLDPRFQGRSARAHETSGATALSDDDLGGARPGARRDVDTVADLARAATLGLGPMSTSLIDPATGRLGAWQTITVADSTDGDPRDLLAITETGHRVRLRLPVVQDHPARLRAGQRLQAVVGTGDVLAAWW